MKIKVYRNLHNGKLSIKQGDKVIGHCRSITMKDVSFICNEKGRDRVRRTKQKNVHAWLEGTPCYLSGFVAFKGRARPQVAIAPFINSRKAGCSKAYYNPYITDEWVDETTRKPVEFAESVNAFCSGTVYYTTSDNPTGEG